jgi:hypothetical protein
MAPTARRVITASLRRDYRLAAIRAVAYAGGSRRKSPPAADDTKRPSGDHAAWMSATELRHRIRLLEVALAAAEDTGAVVYDLYRRTLEEELAWCRTAFVEAAVIEIASLRAAISGPLVG